MRSDSRKKLDDLSDLIRRVHMTRKYRKAARVRNKRMNGGYNCSKEYKQIVLPYWAKYGKKPLKLWYKNYAAETKQVDPRFIPDDIWFSDILPYYSNNRFSRYGSDKCQLGIWFPDVKRPYTVAANIAGVFYDNERNVITADQAAKRCVEYKRFLIKPSIDSYEGRGIRFFDNEQLTEKKMLEVFEDFGCNFIAQEVIRQHPEISRLNSSSLNTLRLVTFLFEGEVYLLSAILRIGASNSRVDNVGAGGYACPIESTGRLSRRAVNRKSEWCETNDSGIRFDSIVIPSYDKAVETVKRLQRRMAHFKIIGWDIGIDDGAEPVLIEYNTAPGQNQYSCGPTFGDITERVLEDVFIKKSLSKSNN